MSDHELTPPPVPSSTTATPPPDGPASVAPSRAAMLESLSDFHAATSPGAAVAAAGGDAATGKIDPMTLGAIGAWQVQRVGVQQPQQAPRQAAAQPVTQSRPEQAPPAPESQAAPQPARFQPESASPAPQGAMQGAAPKPAPAVTTAPRTGSRTVRLWQIATALALLGCLVLATLLARAPERFDTALAPIGVVNTPAPIFLAEIGGDRLRMTPLAIIEVPEKNDLQLWMFMANSDKPITLGVLPAKGGIFTLPQTPQEGARFVISLEPHGGSPAGKIAGQVLYGGTLANR